MQLTPHFTLEELTVTETGLSNAPDPLHEQRLVLLAIFMEKVRFILGNHPVNIDSAYRSPGVNAAVGGVPDSAHELGYACDFVCPQFGSPYDVCCALVKARDEGKIAFDQLIQEGTWTHISRDPRQRGELLTHVDGSYIEGIQP